MTGAAPNEVARRLRRLSAILCGLFACTLPRAQTLNDTGIASSGDALLGNHAGCNGALAREQDCSAGRDALVRDGKLAKKGGGTEGFDFTRVCNNGEAAGTGACPAMPKLGGAAGEWGCTRDNTSGLLWELKTADGGARDRDRTYTNYSAAYNPNREQGNATDAAGFERDVNTTRLCGASGWRLPTRLELIGLMHYGAAVAGPAIDGEYFPNAPGNPRKAVYWTGSAYAANLAQAWGVDASDGVAGDDNRSIYYALRLVLPRATAAHAISPDGQEVKDARTNLIWRRCVEGMAWNGTTCIGGAGSYTWAAAFAQARQQAVASGQGWRLPNLKELASIVDDGRAGPSIDGALFPATPAARFWSASPASSNPAFSWIVNFAQGHLGDHGYRGEPHAVRLVRSAR